LLAVKLDEQMALVKSEAEEIEALKEAAVKVIGLAMANPQTTRNARPRVCRPP
jgi:hypothetical protein